jgi:hypothetical protein
MRKKIMPFPASIFTKFAKAQQHYIQISYIEYHPNWTINVESTDINLFISISKPLFTLLKVCQYISPYQIVSNSDNVEFTSEI